MPRRHADQPDLFAAPDPQLNLFGESGARREPPPEVDAAFMESIRRQLDALHDKAAKADRLPWRDFTASALAEMQFDGLLYWLPREEAEARREAFAAELDRLYEAG